MKGKSSTNSNIYKILLIENNPLDIQHIRDIIADVSCYEIELSILDLVNIGQERLYKSDIDIILHDISPPPVKGLDTFIKILSENPDSLITRKMGEEPARQVSEKARRVIEMGGAETNEGQAMLWSLDEELRKEEGNLNPGTTADITVASLYVLILSGWRP